MKRDLNLIRLIMLEQEGSEIIDDLKTMFATEYGQGFEQIYKKHIVLLIESNLLDGQYRFLTNGTVQVTVNRITWAGYEYLDNIRDNEVWAKTKTMLGRFGSAALPIVQQVAGEIIKSALGIGK